MAHTHSRIGIILGSASDLQFIQDARDMLDRMDEPYELIVASAHRSPERVRQWSISAEGRGLKAIVAAAGAAAALPGVVAAHTLVPVIGLPLGTTPMAGMDSLHSIVQMPPGVPVATVGINNASNAALLALQIVAGADAALRRRLVEYRRSLEEKIEKANAELWASDPSLKPAGAAAGSPEFPPAEAEDSDPFYERIVIPADPAPQAPAAPESTAKRLRIDGDAPAVEALEEAMDTLLDGGIVAIPTDTVYGLAADPNRPAAVERLYALKGRSAEKAIPLLIHSRLLLRGLARNAPEEIEPLLDELWPGPLTVIFRKYKRSFEVCSPGETIGLRMPKHAAAMELLKMIGRPLAVTSANPSGQPPAHDADTLERMVGPRIDLILDAGPLADSEASSVLDVSERPFQLLREGAVSRARLSKILGENLAP